MIDGKLELSEIKDKLIINKKFVLIDSSKYTQEAFNYILDEADKFGAVAFISDLRKIYAQGQYYSDFDELRYFTNIAVSNENGTTSATMSAPESAATLTFVGKGITEVTTDPENGQVIIDTSTEVINKYIDSVAKELNEIALTYATKDYVAENYQETLIAGSYINISEDNIITTYNLPTYTYISNNYATITYVNDTRNWISELQTNIVTHYATKTYAQEIAKDEAAAAVAKVIDGADDAFNTLKEISDWLINSGKYVVVTNSQLTQNPTAKYYVLDADGNYIDANYDEDGNIIVSEGQVTYMYVATTAADIISNINDLDIEVGDNSAYTYIDAEGNIQTFTSNTSELVLTGENKYIYQLASGDWVEITYSPSTGIYKVIDEDVAYLNSKIEAISHNVNDFSKLLYELRSESLSAYATIELTPKTYEGGIGRKIVIDLIEGSIDTNSNSSTYGIITNGLATTYTVNDILNYKTGWVILQGETI